MTIPIGVFLLLLGSSSAGQPKGAAPPPRILDVTGKVLDIVGVTRGLEGTLRDLGAKVTDREIRIELSADVLFNFDKYDLRPDASDSLRKVGDILKEYPKAHVLIEGHTDSKGSLSYNQALSENRALTVKNWLVRNARGDARLISTTGWAETKPVTSNTKPDGSDDPAGRQKNRRVEITIKKS